MDLDLLRSFANCLKKFICVSYNYYTIDCLMTCRMETNQGFRSFRVQRNFEAPYLVTAEEQWIKILWIKTWTIPE